MITSLTSFRFITAFVVFLFHCRIHFNWKLDIRVLDKFFLSGATFMTGFFVLSGFVMAHAYCNTDFTKQKNIFNFYLKRLAKIYPTYIVVTLVYSAVIRDIPSQQYLRVIVNDLFLVQGFFPSMFPIGLNGGTWSLTVEIFLYFLFPFLMILSGQSPKILIVAIILTIIVSLNVKFDSIYSNPVCRVGDFLCGMGFYFLRKQIRSIPFANYLHLITVIVLYLTCKKLGGSYQYMQGQFIIVPLFGVWITMVFYSKSKIYNNKYLEYLGLISYSFFLWQSIAIILGKKLIRMYPDFNLHLLVVMAFVVTFCISALSYHFLEERTRRYVLQKFKNHQVNKI
jgi:peptidoglycan/LPS O-acetylase OafA/YrhL